WRSGGLPLFHLRGKLVMRHRDGGAPFARVPSPRHQFVLRQVLDELIDIAVFIFLRVLDRTANLRVDETLPDHRRGGRRQAPSRRSRRHMRAWEIMVLMAGAALFRGHTVAVGAAPHVHGMRMTVISLPREVTLRMAIHTARIAQDRNEGGKQSTICCR